MTDHKTVHKTVEHVKLSDYDGDVNTLYGVQNLGGVYGMIYPRFTKTSKGPNIHAITLGDMKEFIPKDKHDELVDGNFGEIQTVIIHEGHMDYNQFGDDGEDDPNVYTRIRMFDNTPFNDYIFDEEFDCHKVMNEVMKKRIEKNPEYTLKHGDVVKFQFLGYRTFDYHFWDAEKQEVVDMYNDGGDYGYVPKEFKAYSDFDPKYFDNVLHTGGNVWLDPKVFDVTKDDIVDIDYKRNEGDDYDIYKCVKMVETRYGDQSVNVIYIREVKGNFIYSSTWDGSKVERKGDEIPQTEFTQEDVMKWFNDMEYVMVPWYNCEDHEDLVKHIFGNDFKDHVYLCVV